MNSRKDNLRAVSYTPSLTMRIVLSMLLLVHLTAVFIPPFTFATASGPGSTSPFAEPIMSALRPYIEVMYLDHGYFFFAPNPGPSHLLRAKLEFADGRKPVEVTFPDLKVQRPRLLYHRHFMLAEQLHADFASPQSPPGTVTNPEQFENWQQARQRYEGRRKSFEEHLRAVYGASQVTLTRVEHTLLGPSEFLETGKSLGAADTYRDLPEELPPTLVPGSAP
jgi:hypothetical protein